MTDKEKLIDMYIKGYITYEELLQYLEKPDMPEPPKVY